MSTFLLSTLDDYLSEKKLFLNQYKQQQTTTTQAKTTTTTTTKKTIKRKNTRSKQTNLLLSYLLIPFDLNMSSNLYQIICFFQKLFLEQLIFLSQLWYCQLCMSSPLRLRQHAMTDLYICQKFHLWYFLSIMFVIHLKKLKKVSMTTNLRTIVIMS